MYIHTYIYNFALNPLSFLHIVTISLARLSQLYLVGLFYRDLARPAHITSGKRFICFSSALTSLGLPLRYFGTLGFGDFIAT